MEGVRVYGTIPNSLKEALDKKILDKEIKLSDALTMAIRLWVTEESAGLSISKNLKPRPEVVNHSPIRPGPGAVIRLRNSGINPMDVLMAKRKKARGMEYDILFEQFFNLFE